LRQTSFSIAFSLFCLVLALNAKSQRSKYTPDNSSIARMKASAIHSANAYLEARLSNKQLTKWFIADSSSSLIICNDYKTFFNASAVCSSPIGYEIAFHVVLETKSNRDTLHTNLFLPLDSSFRPKDTVTDMWHDSLLGCWENVILNKYKVNYAEILLFIRQRGLHQYSIDFGYEGSGYKPNSKIFWFVTAADKGKKNSHPFLYRIDPRTGAVKVKKLLPVKLQKDVS
jgi:hypothetical protein